MKKALNYLKEQGKGFIGSFRSLDRTILFVVVYSLVFYISSITAYRKYTSMIFTIAEPVTSMGISDFSDATKEVLASYLKTINRVYLNLFLYAALFALAVIIIYAITNFFIWSAITSSGMKKHAKMFMLKFILLNFIWCIAWVLILILVVASVRTEVVRYWILALLLVYAHLTTLLFMSYFTKKRLGKSIKSAFSAGFEKIHHFIAPYILAAVVFAALNYIIMPIQWVYRENIITVYFIIFLFYFAWLRIYIYSFAKKLVC